MASVNGENKALFLIYLLPLAVSVRDGMFD